MKKFIVLSIGLSCFSLAAADAAAHRSVFRTSGKNGFEIAGDYLQMAIPISALIYSTIIGDWHGNLQLVGTVATTAVTTEAIKAIVHEDRPYETTKRGDSFPSGHTSNAFAGSTYWQRRYGWYIGAPMHIAAAYVGFSRVNAGAHYWWDVVGGAVLGIGIGSLFTTQYVPKGADFSVVPLDGGMMLRFNTEF